MRRHFHLKTRRLTAAAAAAALSLGSLGVAPAFGAFTFTKIVDSNTADPGGAGTINSFSPPALDG
ncbi:MAG TPA: hypothetical protein VLI90_12340, partial [Tepidisphaeraceae bacterium]|nr:hypothetical protein [Tepidisphaeraceae bacterium]